MISPRLKAQFSRRGAGIAVIRPVRLIPVFPLIRQAFTRCFYAELCRSTRRRGNIIGLLIDGDCFRRDDHNFILFSRRNLFYDHNGIGYSIHKNDVHQYGIPSTGNILSTSILLGLADIVSRFVFVQQFTAVINKALLDSSINDIVNRINILIDHLEHIDNTGFLKRYIFAAQRDLFIDLRICPILGISRNKNGTCIIFLIQRHNIFFQLFLRSDCSINSDFLWRIYSIAINYIFLIQRHAILS